MAVLISPVLRSQTWGEATLGPLVRVLPILIGVSALGGSNISLYSAARYCMVGAQYGYLPETFACIHKRWLTPIPSVVFQVSALLGIVLPASMCLSTGPARHTLVSAEQH